MLNEHLTLTLRGQHESCKMQSTMPSVALKTDNFLNLKLDPKTSSSTTLGNQACVRQELCFIF